MILVPRKREEIWELSGKAKLYLSLKKRFSSLNQER